MPGQPAKLFFAVSQEDKQNVSPFPQAAGSLEHDAQIIGQSMGARIQDDKTLAQIEGFTETSAVRLEAEHRCVGAVGQQLHLPRSTQGDVLDEARRIDHHQVSVAVQETLQPLGGFDECGLPQYPHLHRKCRPEISHFEEKRNPF